MHTGHRQRFKDRFLSEGLETFAPHEILELILFYSIPQKDTNETGHLLLERFGSLRGVFEAEFDELITVPGIKENSATLLKLFASVARTYAIDKEEKVEYYDTFDKIGRYLQNLYIGIPFERVYLLLFDNSMRMIDCVHILDGTVNCANITPRTLVEKAIFKHASSAVLAHNHPNGLAIPSREDIELSNILDNAFDILGINFIEHIIVAGNKFAPIMRRQHGLIRTSPITNKIDEDFYLNFYGEEKRS